MQVHPVSSVARSVAALILSSATGFLPLFGLSIFDSIMYFQEIVPIAFQNRLSYIEDFIFMFGILSLFE